MNLRPFPSTGMRAVSIATGLLLTSLSAAADAQSATDSSCTELTRPLFGPAAASCSGTVAQAPASAPQSTADTSTDKSPLYTITSDDIYSIDRDMTAYYYFQSNLNGSAKAKYEYRFARNLWNDNAQFRLRIPIVTQFSQTKSTLSGLANIEVGYSYGVTSKTFDHYLEARVSLPTAVNTGVSSNDTQLKGFYNLKWKLKDFNIAYSNEYDQTIIKPPGSSWTSYYEGKLTFPDFKLLPGLKFSTFYNYRVLFDSYGVWKDALGATLYGNMNDVALSITDSWGVGGSNSLWRYKLELNATARL